MITRFEIYRDGERLREFVPVNAMAVGPESVPTTGQVSFRDGLLLLSRTDDAASGVSLLWNAGPETGCYQMETTRLPPRDSPYNLNVELARFRLMKIVQKQEDWNLFDLKAEKFANTFKEAQGLFAQALAHLDAPGTAAGLADRALRAAIPLSEQIAAYHADLLLNRRKANNQLPRHIVGCRFDWTIQNQRYRELLSDSADYVVVPMPWKQVQPSEEEFNTAELDECIELLGRKRVPIIAGPLIDLSDDSVPDWMYIWEHDFDTMRDLAYEYVRKIVGRYRRSVTAWSVVSGLHAARGFSLSFEQMIELTRVLISLVRTAVPTARTIVTIRQPFGEYHAAHPATVPPMLYAEMVAQSGISFDAFALELEMGVPTRSQYTRDLFQISSMLDKFSTLGKPLFITAIGVPDRFVPDVSDQSDGQLDPSDAGFWQRPWDPGRQGKWFEQFARMALSKPYVENLCWSNFADIHPSLPGGGLLDDSFRPKPSMESLQLLRETYSRAPKKVT